MDGVRLFSVVPRARSNGHQLKHRRFLPNTPCVSEQALPQAAKRGCGVSILGENQKPTGHNPGYPVLDVPGGIGHRCLLQVPSECF